MGACVRGWIDRRMERQTDGTMDGMLEGKTDRYVGR